MEHEMFVLLSSFKMPTIFNCCGFTTSGMFRFLGIVVHMQLFSPAFVWICIGRTRDVYFQQWSIARQNNTCVYLHAVLFRRFSSEMNEIQVNNFVTIRITIEADRKHPHVFTAKVDIVVQFDFIRNLQTTNSNWFWVATKLILRIEKMFKRNSMGDVMMCKKCMKWTGWLESMLSDIQWAPAFTSWALKQPHSTKIDKTINLCNHVPTANVTLYRQSKQSLFLHWTRWRYWWPMQLHITATLHHTAFCVCAVALPFRSF